MIDIVFATDNNFCPHVAVAITSLLHNNKNESITIHLFTIDVSNDNLSKLKSMAEPFENAQISTYQVTKDLFAKFPNPGIYSLACYLRILTPELLPKSDKALYLDCDLIVNGSIKELWDTDIDGYSCAAGHDAIYSYEATKSYLGYDYHKEGYANSGVLLMNLDYWRKHGTQKKLVDFLNTHHVKFPDQDAINIILHGTIKFLHPKWNCHTGYFAFPPLVIPEQRKYIKKLWKGAVITHFTGKVKPWHKECVNPYKKYYLKYKKMTCWNNLPLNGIESSSYKRIKIIALRHLKNLVAKTVSFTY